MHRLLDRKFLYVEPQSLDDHLELPDQTQDFYLLNLATL